MTDRDAALREAMEVLGILPEDSAEDAPDDSAEDVPDETMVTPAAAFDAVTAPDASVSALREKTPLPWPVSSYQPTRQAKKMAQPIRAARMPSKTDFIPCPSDQSVMLHGLVKTVVL